MGYRNFPSEGKRRQRQQVEPCCTLEENLKAWNCWCTWGCDLCWADYECQVCHAKYSKEIKKELSEERIL